MSFLRQSWVPSHVVASMLETKEDSSALPLGVQDEQGYSHMEQRGVVKALCSFRATCREKCLDPDIRGGFGQARGLGAVR